MKETRLGEFEEVILLLVGILGKEAYAYKVAEEFESQTNRRVSIGALYYRLAPAHWELSEISCSGDYLDFGAFESFLEEDNE